MRRQCQQPLHSPQQPTSPPFVPHQAPLNSPKFSTVLEIKEHDLSRSENNVIPPTSPCNSTKSSSPDDVSGCMWPVCLIVQLSLYGGPIWILTAATNDYQNELSIIALTIYYRC